MNRTNIYLDESQTADLKRTAKGMSITRSELVRRLINRGLYQQEREDIATDLTAIRESFAALAGDGPDLDRSPSDRECHIARMWGL